VAKKFEEFIKETQRPAFFTSKHVSKGILNQAPVQRTRAYDSGTYKNATTDYITNRGDNVYRPPEEEPELDINYADEILDFEEYYSDKIEESVNVYKSLNSLTLDQIEQIRNLWKSLSNIYEDDWDDIRQKVEKSNQRKISSFLFLKDWIDRLALNSVLDYFSFGLDEENSSELSVEKAPTTKELYDHFQSNLFRSNMGIKKYDL